MAFADFYKNKRVLVTGHTGFKGSWLAEWLLQLGAEVHGIALPPPTTPALFDQLVLSERLEHHLVDIRDFDSVARLVKTIQPDVVFHLAAQPLVRLSYEKPVETYATNVLGTVHVLEAVRLSGRPCTTIAITTDKCYENREWVHSYREEDPMGGYDPYSSSKGAAELAISAYRRSYFQHPTSPIQVASARAGNVIGGGDWALDRIVPDCIRALVSGKAIPVRNRIATRPWQHVLEPLSGYLWLAVALSGTSPDRFYFPAKVYAGGFNFGPALSSNRTVAELVQQVLQHWPGTWEDRSDPAAVHEAKLLNLATDKAHHLLQWKPVWDFDQTIEHTVTWYKSVLNQSKSSATITQEQIARYSTSARAALISWAL